jgi:cyclophilin family peptidyl-prolyl cis-trans isomerase
MRRAWLAAATAALVLAACGGDDADPMTEPAGDDAPAEEPNEEPSEEPADEPADNFGILVPGDPSTGKPDVQLPAEAPTELVVTTLEEGGGDVVAAGDSITVDYVGVLTVDGTEFDNSYDRGQPITLTIGAGQVIPGWDQGLVGVTEGSRVQLDIPADLGYGEEGAGPIPPGSALTFVVDIREPLALAPEVDTANCPAVDGSSEQQQEFGEYPPTCVDVTKSYTAEIVTNFGSITVELDPGQAPLAVNSFVTLSRYHYFDGTECHRAIPGFVVQCGDPTATGTGGPGYRFPDELPEADEYEIGSLAMANSGPDTNGSQFFIVTGESGAALPPQYTLFGQVTEGLDTTVPELDAVANPESNGVPPLEQILIESVTITES